MRGEIDRRYDDAAAGQLGRDEQLHQQLRPKCCCIHERACDEAHFGCALSTAGAAFYTRMTIANLFVYISRAIASAQHLTDQSNPEMSSDFHFEGTFRPI